MIRRRIGRHGAEHQGAFEAEIHASGFLRQTLAERYEHERRGYAKCAADDRKQHDEEWAVGHWRASTRASVVAGTRDIFIAPASGFLTPRTPKGRTAVTTPPACGAFRFRYTILPHASTTAQTKATR